MPSRTTDNVHATLVSMQLSGQQFERRVVPGTVRLLPSESVTENYSEPEVPFWEVLCLLFSTFLAVSKGATQRQSIYLILRSPVAQKRAVSNEVVWNMNPLIYARDNIALVFAYCHLILPSPYITDFKGGY